MNTHLLTAAAAAGLLAAAPAAHADLVRLSDLIGRESGFIVGGKQFIFHSFSSETHTADEVFVEPVDRGQANHGFRLVMEMHDDFGDILASDGQLSFTVQPTNPARRIIRDRIGFAASTSGPLSWVRLNEHVFAPDGTEILSRSFLAEGNNGRQGFGQNFNHEGDGHHSLLITQDVWIFSGAGAERSSMAHFMERTFLSGPSMPLPSASLVGGAGLLSLILRRRRR